ncbi:hypothetical protein ACOMHN_051498 [Nucella lapillus]
MFDEKKAERMKELETRKNLTAEEKKEHKYISYYIGNVRNSYHPRTITVQNCVSICWAAKILYVGLQKGFKCMCGMDLDSLVVVNDNLCYSRCEGNCRQYCGGHAAISVYSTGYAPPPDFSKFDINKGIFGCREQMDLTYNCNKQGYVKGPDIHSPLMTPYICATYCRSTGNQVAAFRSNEFTCCCDSRSYRRPVWQQASHPLKYCGRPCGGAKLPCVGFYEGRFVSVLINVLGPQIFKGEPPDWNFSDGSIIPSFPVINKYKHEKFEHELLKPPVGAVAADERSHNKLIASTPGVDNTKFGKS